MRLIAILAVGLAGVVACGDDPLPPGGQPELATVNGARRPVVAAGQLAGWGGFGFGTGQGTLLVTTASGLTAIEVLEWSDVGITARLPDDAISGPTWVVTSADSLGPIPLLVRPAASYTPGARAWTESAAIPEPRITPGGAALHYPGDAGLGGIVVLFGGALTDGTLPDSTYIGQVNEGGAITGWGAAPDTVVPAGRRDHVMVGADPTNSRIDRQTEAGAEEGVAYAIGGRDAAGAVLADVEGIAVSSAAGYGLWSRLTPLPGGRGGAAALVAFGNVIVIGGYGPDSRALPDVTVAAITSGGTLNGWFDGPPLPEGRAFAAAALVGQTLFVTGGERDSITPPAVSDTARLTGTVFAIRLSPQTGAFLDSVWTTVAAALLHPRSRHAATALDDALVVTGGVYAGMPSSGESEFAFIAPDGTPGPFAETPPPTLAALAGAPPWSFGAPPLMARDGTWRATVLGGATSAGLTARTWTQ